MSRRNPNFVPEQISEDLHDQAEAFATQQVGLQHHPDPRFIFESLLGNMDEKAKLSDAEHLEIITSAYAAFVLLQRRPDFSEFVVELADEVGTSIRKNTDPMTIILRKRIRYGETKGTAKSTARQLYERDAKAIRYLMSNGIGPTRVSKEASTKGEGLDTWSRRFRASHPAGKLKDTAPEKGSDFNRMHCRTLSNGTLALSISRSDGYCRDVKITDPELIEACNAALQLIVRRNDAENSRAPWGWGEKVEYQTFTKSVRPH